MQAYRPILTVFTAVTLLTGVAACAGSTTAWAPTVPVGDRGLFADKDLDRSGTLSREELAQGLPDAQTDRLFAALDRNDDGQLSLAEYFPDPAFMPALSVTARR